MKARVIEKKGRHKDRETFKDTEVEFRDDTSEIFFASMVDSQKIK